MDQKAIEARVEQIISPVLDQDSIELVDVTCRLDRGRWVLGIFIDKPGGVNIDDCADVSRKIGDLIDIEDIVSQRYVLEVSSPGLDRVLKKDKDFQKFSGRKIKLKTHQAQNGRRNFKGKIVRCEQGIVELEDEEGRVFRFPLTDIEKARLEIEEKLF